MLAILCAPVLGETIRQTLSHWEVDYLGLLPCLRANPKPVAKTRLMLPKLNNICLPDGAVAPWAGAEQEKKPPPVFSGVEVSSDGMPYILKAIS